MISLPPKKHFSFEKYWKNLPVKAIVSLLISIAAMTTGFIVSYHDVYTLFDIITRMYTVSQQQHHFHITLKSMASLQVKLLA